MGQEDAVAASKWWSWCAPGHGRKPCGALPAVRIGVNLSPSIGSVIGAELGNRQEDRPEPSEPLRSSALQWCNSFAGCGGIFMRPDLSHQQNPCDGVALSARCSLMNPFIYPWPCSIFGCGCAALSALR